MSENDNQETIADIVAEMRDRAKRPDFIAPGVLRDFADRVEAAWKREIAEVEASALDVGGVVEASRHTGNAAAMREALEFADKELRRAIEDSRYGDDVVYLVGCMRSVASVCRAAISAPLRNCDRFVNEAEARKAFIVWYNTVYELNGDKWNEISSCDLKHDVDNILQDYIKWLFATAAERKGEGDGSK